jgi:hypothetical protein
MLKNGFVMRTSAAAIVALCRNEQAKTIVNVLAHVAGEILPAIREIHLPPDM